MAALLSIATAVPPHRLRQSDILAAATKVFSPRYPGFERMAPVFTTAGIESRYAIMPLEWYTEPRGWTERMDAYVSGASRLFATAAARALEGAKLRASDIDAIVTVSSTGIAAPSLEARAARALGFRPNVLRTPIFGLGCAGGVTGLATADRLAEAAPGSNVLFVAVETCTTAFRLDQMSKANIVATALFGDGAGACVVRAGPGGAARIGAGAEHMWPDTLDIMGWGIDETGFSVIFDRSIPDFAASRLAPAVDASLMGMGLERANIDRFICHPGGAKVISAIEDALDLRRGALDHERAVLAENGNMSAPTVLFTLQRMLRAGLPRRSVLMALGPGFTLSLLSLTAAA